MAKGSKKKKLNSKQVSEPIITTSVSGGTKLVQLTQEEEALLKFAKESIIEIEPDLQAFKSLLEGEYSNQYNEKKEELELILEEESLEFEKKLEKERLEFQEKLDEERLEFQEKLDKERLEFQGKLKEENDELIKSNDELIKSNDDLKIKKEEVEREILSLKDKIKDMQEKQEKIISDATKKADLIVNKAKKDAKKQMEKISDEITTRKNELDKREEDIEDKEIELDSRQTVLEIKERRVSKQAKVYETANPDLVESLKKQYQLRGEQLESIQKEYEDTQRELNKIRIKMLHFEGTSPEELQRINEQLYVRIEELENKCNRYTDEELNQMKAAFEAKDGWLTQIRNLTNEVSSNRLELTRVNNSIREYEQLKAQMELLRTLNEHLRNELDNTKRMLESSVGEVCPALTSIDIDESAESGESFRKYNQRRLNINNNEIRSLYDVVKQVKTYAASQEKPLFYSDKDLRAFIAGMAASQLAILQGMSGTGKTSLPKIFTEAILGEINIVPVESSWRDRNELLGYYNDFSKKFTAKEFTCDLYRASCSRYEDTIYFIVLDEMNLSRIEYYFADFLSVLEDKKDKWLIKLVDTDMRQLPTEITEEVIKALDADNNDESKQLKLIIDKLYPDNILCDEENVVSGNDKLRLIAYLSNKNFKNKSKTRSLVGGPQNLINGNTIRIPKNVWFIGTANRDESTFEITDKVYDRAQVLNFNSRASGEKLNINSQPIFLTYSDLMLMFSKAVHNKQYSFRAENSIVLQEVENILKKYFRISYGNRIQDQMNTFVPVYVAAGIESKYSNELVKKLENEAIDYQLTSKVLRKLEYEDINKEAAEKLRKIFEKNGLEQAREFINWKIRGEEI